MAQIKSRVNGLTIGIPADARGVVSRFATAGGNELVFEKPAQAAAAARGKGKPGKQNSKSNAESLA